MIDRRPFNKLGGGDHDWLKAKHHFSFGEYADPARIGWGALRVWNDDEIAPGAGFPPHPHANMEIITYVREGAVTHKDSLGNEGRTEAGDVQVMSAGAGIRHAEYNLEQQPTKIFQIWIIPSSGGGSPAWGSQPFPKADLTKGELSSGPPGRNGVHLFGRACPVIPCKSFLLLDRSFFHWRLLPKLFFRSSDLQLPRRLRTRRHHNIRVCDYLIRRQLPGDESSRRQPKIGSH